MKKNIMCLVALLLSLAMLIPANIITADAAPNFYDIATVVPIKNHIEKDGGLGNYATVQGACTDSKYAYFAVNTGYTTLLKYNVDTWELVKKSSGNVLGHANDMTFNPYLNKLVVAHNSPDYDVISFVDPDSLNVVETRKIKHKIHSISYNANYNQYVVGLSGTYDFAILDNSFKEVEKFKGYDSGFLRQGGDCDDEYLYFVQSGGGGNLIVIYDWHGNLIDTVSVNKSLEIENIFHVGNTVYTTLHYYGNFVNRLGISDKTAVKFDIKFDSNGGNGSMDSITVTYGKEKELPACTFEKENYHFGGWIMERDSYKTTLGKKSPYGKDQWLKTENVYEYSLFKDKGKVSKTTNVGNVTAKAFWIADEYQVNYDANGGEGTMPSRTVRYDEVFKIDEHNMTRHGHIFTGWTAQRDCDGKVYGYLKDKDTPAWLKPKHVAKPYVFSDSQEVSELTYDGNVTFSAHWQLAFSFSKDGTELNKYIGIDEEVDFPKDYNKVSKICDEAFKDCQTIKSVTIPATINTVGKNVFADCTALREIHFDKNLPQNVDRTAFNSPYAKKCYLKKDKDDIFIGLYTGCCSYEYLYYICNNFFL
ncbi:MAG: InlB B-repeat-containing protein [Ruminococcus sp.]|nr:InlB B-repeat-containing protein [Ruminococcus sp.]